MWCPGTAGWLNTVWSLDLVTVTVYIYLTKVLTKWHVVSWYSWLVEHCLVPGPGDCDHQPLSQPLEEAQQHQSGPTKYY